MHNPSTAPWQIRAATPGDVDPIFALILELAAYEQLTHQVTGSSQLLKQHLFGSPTCAEALVAVQSQTIIGFALFFQTYSTFLTQPGLYLEDLYVQEPLRGQGIGTALLQTIAAIAQARGCGRLEWTVLDWNDPAIRFYEKMGATVLPDWRICRVMDQALIDLAQPTAGRTDSTSL